MAQEHPAMRCGADEPLAMMELEKLTVLPLHKLPSGHARPEKLECSCHCLSVRQASVLQHLQEKVEHLTDGAPTEKQQKKLKHRDVMEEGTRG